MVQGTLQLVRNFIWREFDCGSEIRVKRKLLLLLWHKRPLCPRFLFLFLICNHFLTDVRVACFLASSLMLQSVSYWPGLHRAGQRPCTCAHTTNRSQGAWCWPAKPDGIVQPCVLRHDNHVQGACLARSSHFPCQHDPDQSARRLHK